MAKLSYRAVSKHFEDKQVLNTVSLDIADGELMALLGPSGCGKTTMLRLAAGFERPTAGEILKNDHILSDQTRHVAPEARNMGIVFQSYALWPNMTVAQNVSYPLNLRKMPEEKRDTILSGALEAVSLLDFADASPATLSGGQRQRVALARCLVMEPDAVLLDEPLANLDAHLREIMQRSFIEFHQQTRATMVYVTHDQAEAMAMADRIAVMFSGQIAQVAPPQELYHCPATEQVARFIGQGSILVGHLDAQNNGARRAIVINGQEFEARQSGNVEQLEEAQPIKVCVRPEHVDIQENGVLAGKVCSSVYLGERYRVNLVMNEGSELVCYSPIAVKPGELVRFSLSDAWAFEAA